MSDAVYFQNVSVQSSELGGDITTRYVREGEDKSKMDQDKVECDTKNNVDSEVRNLRVTYSETEECADNEGGDVKKVFVAAGHNISKRALEVKRMVVSPGDDVEVEGKASCSNMKTSVKVVNPSVEGANASNEEVLRVDAEGVLEGVESLKGKEESTEGEKMTDDMKEDIKKRVMNVVEGYKEKINKMPLSVLDELPLEAFDNIELKKELSDFRCRHARLEKDLECFQKITADLLRQLDDMNFSGEEE